MAVNEALSSLSTTASSNTPAGNTTVGTNLDDHLRDIKKNIRFASNTPVQAAKTTAYTVVATDHNQLVQVDASASAVVVTLLAAATAGDGFRVGFKRVNAGSNNVTIDGNSSETIDGSITTSLTTQHEVKWLACNGSLWKVEGGYRLPTSFLSNVVEDTTPQLGGDLDAQANSITTSTTNGDIKLAPDGTGAVSVAEVTDYENNITADDDLTNRKYVQGHASVIHAIGEVTTGTQTPEPATGFFKTLTNGGAFTLAPPTTTGYYLLVITNNASAGAITTSGFGDVFGDAFTTTNGHVFMCLVIDDGTNSVLKVKALQ